MDPNTLDVVVSNRCADVCAEIFVLSDRAVARGWLLNVIRTQGTVVDRLPAPMTGRRSPSGWFLLAEHLFVLPLALDTDAYGRQTWVATNCLAVPRYGRVVDPTALNGPALLTHVRLTTHAVERFQQRGGGHPDPASARAQLTRTLTPTVHASPRPPAWWRSRERAEFYLVAGDHDEWCLPMHTGDGAQAFDATTCMHRATYLFELDPKTLATKCRIDEQQLPAGSRRHRIIQDALTRDARLSWHRPRRARPNPWATWWLLFGDKLSAAVSWEPDHPQPLIIRSVDDRRPVWVRWFSR